MIGCDRASHEQRGLTSPVPREYELMVSKSDRCALCTIP